MVPFVLAWDQAPHWGKKEKTISVRGKKICPERGKGGGPFPVLRPPLGSVRSRIFFVFHPFYLFSIGEPGPRLL